MHIRASNSELVEQLPEPERDELLSDSLHYKEIENGVLREGANPSAKGGSEDEDWATNATQIVSKGADQL
uniref:Uncharacterized protein n=2 Tax=Tanacetum cinerariifolium TaxID=118510 RepID=A0A6L2NJL5_TANCI|nr:hypothetical protein [Tanacetum cinerariifolium]